MKAGDFVMVMTPGVGAGFVIVRLKNMEDVGKLESNLKDEKVRRVYRPYDLEEGDEVVVDFTENGKHVMGMGEITSVTYSMARGFSVYLGEHSTNPGESFHVFKESIKYKL